MELSSTRLTLIRSTSKHEPRILVAGASLFVLETVLGVLEIPNPGLSRFAFGASGVAAVYFAQSEALARRRPLTLGHQLTVWWFWPFVVPVFLVATRNRRPMPTTLALVIPIAGFFLLLIGLFVSEIMRIP
jgi:hypothetical protein